MNIPKPLLTVTKNMPVLDVINLMNQAQTSYALVLDQQELVGIFTEKNVFCLAKFPSAFANMTVAELMSQPVITLSETDAKDLPKVVQRFRQYGISHLPILDIHGQVLSVVTQDEVIERLCQTLDSKTVELEHEIAQKEQMNKLLTDKEAIIQDILDSAIATSIVSFRVFPNRDWQFDYQSPGCEALFGYTSQEILNQKNLWMSRVHPQDRETVIEPLFEDIFAGSTVTIEYRFHHKDGSLRWICANYTSRYDAVANCWIVTGISSDIKLLCERLCQRLSKQTELTLHEREAMLQGIGDHLPNGVLYQVIRERDGSDRFSYLSAGIERLMEVSADAALRDSSLLYCQLIAADLPRFHQAVEQSMQNMSVLDIQLQIQTPSGQLKWLDFCSTPRQLHDGRVAWDGLVVDITDIKQTEETLRKNEALLAESQRLARLGNWECDVATGKPIWSKELFHLLNLNPVELAPNYQEILGLWHPEDAEKLQQAIQEAIATGTSYHLILRVPQPDESNIYLEVIGHAQFNTDGKVIRLYGTAQDVTARQEALNERKRAEQALLENEAFLRSIYYGVGLSIFVVDVVDDDFRFVALNPTHESLTGVSTDELSGKTPEQVFSPAVAASVRQHYQDCITAGKTITYEECLPFQGKDSWWITSLTPLKDENSRIYRIVGNSLNISDVYDELRLRKHTEQILELQAVITRNMAEGICLVRARDSVFVYTNPKFEQMFGYDPGELIGQHVSIVNYADAHTNPRAVNQAIRAALLEHGETSYEVQNVKKDGTPFWCCATASVFEHPEYGTVFVAVQQDITEQKKAEDKLKASLKEKEVLLKEMHHRVKNNLGIVSSLLQMQCRRIQEPQATSILRDSQNRIASIALVHEKLYGSENLSDIDFAQYILDLTTHLFKSYNFSSNNIQLNIQVDPINLDIETAIPCGLIINELVSNALKYAFPCQRAGEIQLICYQECKSSSKILHQHDLILIIRDNGVGLPADFESKNAKTLGMTLLHGLVNQLRGKIQIHSQQGTEFKIIFSKNKAKRQ